MSLEITPFLHAVITTAIIVVGAIALNFAATRALNILARRSALSPEISLILRRSAQWILLSLVLFLILQSWGILNNAWALLTAVLGLVAIGFVAVWSVLSNVLCALVLLMNRSYRIGDLVTMPSENLQGVVVDFNVIFTTLRDPEGDLIQIPNNLFLQKPIKRKPGVEGAELQEQLVREGPADEKP